MDKISFTYVCRIKQNLLTKQRLYNQVRPLPICYTIDKKK
nr:MAG TPA: hypothetical protein [Caudoviricetes sp.]